MSKVRDAEARKARILEKLNKKYDGNLGEEAEPLIQPEEPKKQPIQSSNATNVDERPVAPTKAPEKTEIPEEKVEHKPQKTESAFDEYKKLKKYENFQKSYKRFEKLFFALFGIICSIVIVFNLPMNENLGTIYITIEVLNISLQQFYKSKFGTEYFNKSEMTLDIMNKFGALKNMVDLVGSFTKHMALLVDRVNNVSLFLLFLVISTEIFVYLGKEV